MQQTTHPTALFRLAVIKPLASREPYQRGELQSIATHLAALVYSTPQGVTQQYSAATLLRWRRYWLKGGIEALAPKTRCDRGSTCLSSSLQSQLVQRKKAYPAHSIATLIQAFEREGIVGRGELSKSTVHRFLQTQGLSQQIIKPTPQPRGLFQASYAGQLWQGDITEGPLVHTIAGPHPSYLISLIDDASRFVVHAAFAFQKDSTALEGVLKTALLKHGLPDRLLLDNERNYHAGSLGRIGAKLGILILHSAPRNPAGKGKVERYQRSVQERFIQPLKTTFLNDLPDLNARLHTWLEAHYHNQPHGGLNGLTPKERYQQDLPRIRQLGALAPQIDRYFYHYHTRKVRQDGTLRFKGTRYAVDLTPCGGICRGCV